MGQDIGNSKFCKICGHWKQCSEFGRAKKYKDGLNYLCNDCANLKHRKWYQRNLEQARNKGRINRIKYYWNHKERNLKAARLWRKENPEKMSFIKKNWNDNNQERNKIINQAWVEKNRDRVRSINNKASLRYYYFGNGKVIRFNRRAKEKNAKGSFTLEEWQDLLKKFNHVCPMCRLKEPEIKLTVDHIIPISIGGTNYISNIQPLCKVCNSIKGIKTIDLRALAII